MTNTVITEPAFLDQIDQAIDRYAMLSHPFYKAWSEGALTRQTLAAYAVQYYAHVRAFPTYVSATHSNCDDLAVRRMLLENLLEEEHGTENHPELWLRFAEALGVSRDKVKTAELIPSTVESVNSFKTLTRSSDYIEGVASLYAYESQIPEIARTKRAGLKDFYGIDDERSVGFFLVHEEADLDHRRIERNILARECVTAESRERAISAAETAAKALWSFLDGIQAHCIDHQEGEKA